MTLVEIEKDCTALIERLGESALSAYAMPGNEPHGTKRKLFGGAGPVGTVVYQYDETRVMVIFSAREVLDYITVGANVG